MMVSTINYNRSNIEGVPGSNLGKAVDVGTIYIEDRLRMADPTLDRATVFGSLLAEIRFLSKSTHALVGTSSSWVTRLLYFAMVGRRLDVPFVFLDQPFRCFGLKPCPVT